MKAKNLGLMFLGMLTIVFMLGSVSALTISTTPSVIPEFTYRGQSQDVQIEGDGDFDLVFPSGFSDFFSVSPSSVTSTNLTTITLTLESLPSTRSENTFTIKAVNSTNASIEDSFSIKYLNSFCNFGPQNDSRLELYVSVRNRGSGSDSNWLPLDEIEVEVELRNLYSNFGDMDLENVMFRMGLFEVGSTRDLARNMIWISDGEQYEFGSIDEGDDGKHVFKFRVNPDEIDSRRGNYMLMVKAYPDRREAGVCIDYSRYLDDFGSSEFYANIRIEKESNRDKMIIIDKHSYPLLLETSCNQVVTFTADVWNVGNTNRLSEDQILVTLFNYKLGIEEEVVLLGDLDEGERKEVSFTFEVPRDVDEGNYIMYMRTYYDYNVEGGNHKTYYNRVSHDSFPIQLKIAGGCVYATPENTDISAFLDSEAKAGENLILRTIVTNKGDKTSEYMIDLSKYSSWASLVDVSPLTFKLGPGQSQEIEIIFKTNKDSGGIRFFDINVLSGGYLVKVQPIEVEIESRRTLSRITGGMITEDNWQLWGIGIFNVILIILILVVVIRIVKSRE